MIKKSRFKYYNKWINDGNVQSHNQEESKLNSIINANSDAPILTQDKI